MNTKFRYASTMEAINELREHGFDKDFRLEGDYLMSGEEKFTADELKILAVYRYEGNTNPGDESTTYGIETTSGLKGILIFADGIYADANPAEILKALHTVKNAGYQGGS